MLRRTLMTLLAAGLMMTTGQAQQSPPETQKPEKPAAQPAPAPPQPASLDRAVNIKVELTITDQVAPGEAAKRNISMILADGHPGSIRSSGSVLTARERFNVGLNVDATPLIVKPGLIRLQLSVEYQPKPGSENVSSGEGRAQLNERLTLMVQSGKPMIISQASDPTSDRRIVVELTATVLQ